MPHFCSTRRLILYKIITCKFIAHRRICSCEVYSTLETAHYSKEEQDEIKKIASRLDPDEAVEIVARQSRFKPGGSQVTPDTIFVTNKRVIIRNPSMLGARQKVDSIAFNQITSIQLGKGVFSSTIKLIPYGYQEDIE